MNGYGSHTYMWVNAAGERFWVKYHFKTDQGIEFFTQDEADQMAAVDTDYHQRDLYEAIGRGEYPSWTLKMQIMPFEEAKTYRFNPFDLTKVWPHGDYPLHEVGRLTLNRNPTDFYKQIPVNRPQVPVHSYSKDGVMRVENVSDPVYAPNSKGGPAANPERFPYVEKWEANGEFIHAAYSLR